MIYETRTTLTTHFDQVDYNRHINGAAYEQFAHHARRTLLASLGWDQAKMLKESLRARPAASRMEFLRQQDAGTPLTVHTRADFRRDGRVQWSHDIRNDEKGETACRIEMETRLLQGDAPGIPPNVAESNPETAGPFPSPAEFRELTPFRGECERLEFNFRSRYADGNYFNEVPPSVIWKMIEECRQVFAAHVGLTVENCLAHDALLFTSSGEYRFAQPLPPARDLKCFIWLDELEKIRCGMRHEIMDTQTGEILHTAREAFIVVAPSRMRPRRAPQFMLDAVGDYLAPGREQETARA